MGFVSEQFCIGKATPGAASARRRGDIEQGTGGAYSGKRLSGCLYGCQAEPLYKGDQTILMDPENHRMQYQSADAGITAGTGEELKQWADQLILTWFTDAAGLVCTQTRNRQQSVQFVYCQKKEGLYLYFNRVILQIQADGSMSAAVQYYHPGGYEGQKKEIRPLDELMYGAMKEIVRLKGEEEQVMLTEIRSGYDRSSDGQCVYCIEFVLDNGKTVRMNGYSNEILSAA